MVELLEGSRQNPFHIQLREIIRSRIEDGEYSPGSAIPSENEFAQEFNLNRMTVRNAISALEHEGLLKPVQGKGVFVVGNKISRDLEKLSGFHQTMKERNVSPMIRILNKSIREAGIKYACIFGVQAKDPIYYIRRLNLAENEPVSIEEIYIPKNILPNLENYDLNVFSLYEIYDFNNIKLHSGWQTLSIITADPHDARILNINADTSVLLFECTSHDLQGNVIEFSRSYTRGDTANYSVTFSKTDLLLDQKIKNASDMKGELLSNKA